MTEINNQDSNLAKALGFGGVAGTAWLANYFGLFGSAREMFTPNPDSGVPGSSIISTVISWLAFPLVLGISLAVLAPAIYRFFANQAPTVERTWSDLTTTTARNDPGTAQVATVAYQAQAAAPLTKVNYNDDKSEPQCPSGLPNCTTGRSLVG